MKPQTNYDPGRRREWRRRWLAGDCPGREERKGGREKRGAGAKMEKDDADDRRGSEKEVRRIRDSLNSRLRIHPSV